MPRSRATCAIGLPDSNTNRTARSRISSEYLRGRDIDRSSTSSRTDHPGFEAPAKLSLAHAGREPGGFDARLAAVAVAGVDLGLQQRGGELLEGPFLVAGAVGEFGQRPRCGWCLEDLEEVRELRCGPGHAISWS